MLLYYIRQLASPGDIEDRYYADVSCVWGYRPSLPRSAYYDIQRGRQYVRRYGLDNEVSKGKG